MNRSIRAILFAAVISGYGMFSLGSNDDGSKLSAQEIGFLEEFVLASDREKVLKQLVPGTENYYYFHALHYQNTQKLDKVDELLKPWIKRFGQTSLVKQIRNRQELLKYSDDPASTLKYLTDELNLNFNHQREIPQTQRDLPTGLDPKLIATDRLVRQALDRHKNTDGFTEMGLRLLAGRTLNKTQRRHLLERLGHPDYPNLVDLIVADLKERDSRGFGAMKIHAKLTLRQLDELAEKFPKAKTLEKFVNVYLSKLHPSEDINWRADPDEHRKYLDRLWSFVAPLNPNFNSLKACVLYRRLELNRTEGKIDRDMFLEYLKLPRNVFYINPELIKNIRSRSYVVNLNANYADRIMLMPIANDEPLIRDYLHHLLLDATDFKDFEPYVRDNYLSRQFAIVKILNGIGDSEKWASLLSPEEYKQVLNRIDVEFASTNPEFFQADDAVELELHIKNVQNLIVKVFEINTDNYYRKYKREIDTDVNLDGLVPNFENTYTFDDPPALRKKRQFKFPEIKQRGVYVVDFIAGGKSSRALIRKGRLQMSGEVTAAGQLFSIIDQLGTVVTDANLWIAGARYSAEPSGKILVPFSTNPGRVNAIISHGDFSCLQSFDHIAEDYQFNAAMVVDRENLNRSNTARVMIRPSLKIVGGNPVPVSLLKKPKLVVTAVNQDGISTTKIIDDIKLSEKSETLCEFIVPPRMKAISMVLSAEIRNASRNQTQNVSATQSYSINTIDQSDVIQDVHLVPTSQGYFLEFLGKSGEVRPKQAVRVTFQFEQFNSKVNVDLQSDARGLIALGPLEKVRSIQSTAAGGSKKVWQVHTQNQNYPRNIHSTSGTPIELPAPAGIVENSRDSISLMEVRRRSYVADHFESVNVKDGLIRIEGLNPGDYELRLTYLPQTGASYFKTIKIRVTQGKKADNVFVGKHRHLESRGSQSLHVARITTNNEKIRVELDNADELTRIHVVANRYQPAFDAYQVFAQIRDLEPWTRSPSLRRSVYMEGRKIGDEYDYILRRKYASKYPGNMLERPSLLLNPWEVQQTSNKSQDAVAGNEYGRAGNDADSTSERGKAQTTDPSGNTDFANLDFLGDDAVLLANLKPSKNGVVTIDRKALGKNQHVRFVALNAFDTIQRKIDLPLMPLKPRDARLTDSLDPDKHFSQAKQTEVLKKGSTLLIEDMISAKFQPYDDLGDVYQLFRTLNSNTHLAKFEFILSWEDKTKQEKQSLYSKFACHELSFFLKHKDPKFFTTVVLPHLQNKRDKTFMDVWLLEENLEKFTAPWHYARLNVVEKILLAKRLEDRSSDIERNINELYLLTPTSRAQFDRLYDTTILGLGLDGSGPDLSRFSRNDKELPDLSFSAKGKSAADMDEMKLRISGGVMVDSAAMDDRQGGGMGGGGFGGGEIRSRAKSMESLAKTSPAAPAARPSDLANAKKRNLARKYAEIEEEQESINGRVIPGRSRRELAEQSRSFGYELGDAKMAKGLGVERDEKDVSRFFDTEQLGALQEKAGFLYRRLSPTKEWMENNYYRLQPNQQTHELVRINRFWRDYGNHQGGEFLSPYFSEAHRTFTEMMFALSVLDLPLNGPEQKYDYANNSLTMTAGGPTVVLHQQVRDAIFNRGNTTILVSENFFQKNDRYRHEDGVRFDKFVTGDFLAHTLYGSQVVITNPTSTPRAVELLIQIPLGSVSCSGSQETRTIQFELDAFSTQTFEYSFYFPTAGNFDHYPAHVSAEEKVLAVADGVTFKVIDRPADVDKTSWEFVSQNGTNDEVIDFLNQENILRLNLAKIAFRLKDKQFFQRAIQTLRNRYVYNHTLWSYSIKHDETDAIVEYMSHADPIVRNCGRYFKSDLLTINPVERNWYQHKEYWPLVNDRAHQLGPQRKILNPNFFGQYQNLLSVLSNRRELSDDDHLVITYYMLLQDRIETALEHFGNVSRDSLPSKIQYDYCDAYLDMYRENPNEAAAKAAKWADYPVDLWRNRFKHILSQVDEINGGQTETVNSEDNAQKQTELASKSESFDFEIESDIAKLKYQNIDAVKINFYEMDIELLFSRSPFALDELDGFSMIRPNFTQDLSLETGDNGKGNHEFELPSNMRNKNVLVEVVAGDQAKSQPYFAHSLDAQVLEKFGQVHVTHEETGKAISKTYIKVYARMPDGSVRFHKDGYTDLRGRFDYVSQSNRSIDGIQKYSILVLSEENGAVIRQSNPPKE